MLCYLREREREKPHHHHHNPASPTLCFLLIPRANETNRKSEGNLVLLFFPLTIVFDKAGGGVGGGGGGGVVSSFTLKAGYPQFKHRWAGNASFIVVFSFSFVYMFFFFFFGGGGVSTLLKVPVSRKQTE